VGQAACSCSQRFACCLHQHTRIDPNSQPPPLATEHKVVTQKNLLMTGPQVVQAHVAGKRRKGAKKVRGPPTGLMNDEQFFSYQSNIVVR